MFIPYIHINATTQGMHTMIQTIALPAPRARAASLHLQREPSFKVEQFSPGTPGRSSLEAFIASSFFDSYGAQVSHFCHILLGCRDAQGNWIAALGYTPAAYSVTFLEQYLDQPVEIAVSTQVREKVHRADIVEVGNLAALYPGAARALIISTTHLLHDLGMRWVAFTATVSLLNSFSRLRLQPQVLAIADPARLADGGLYWGSYYDTQPTVMFGDIQYGYVQLT
jgi:hypothetical protein